MRLAIIGAGPGGYVAAIRAAQLGAQVTVIEDTEVGGTCLNRGCIPTKALVASAEAIDRAGRLDEFGLELTGNVRPDIARIMERKEKVVAIQVKGIKGLFKSWGVRLVQGRGVIASPRKIRVDVNNSPAEEIDADRIIIATGSRPAQIPTFPFDGEKILSSTDALNLKDIPKSILIVGAGVVGCEFAFIFRGLGSDVTMVEMLPRAVSTEDEEISAILERELKKKKIKLLTDTKVNAVELKDDEIHAFLGDGKVIVAEKVLVSIGRSFNSDGMGIEDVGIKKGPRGEIVVDDRMQTNVDGVYAIGDVIGGILLAHVASKEGLIAAANALGKDERMDYSIVPAAIFTSPEIASVGLRENQAIQRGYRLRIGRFQFRGLGKAHAMGEISGIIKLIANAEDDALLGAHIIGPHASDLIHEIAIALRAKLKIQDIANTIHAHPTLSEGLMEAAEDAHNLAIHAPRK